MKKQVVFSMIGLVAVSLCATATLAAVEAEEAAAVVVVEAEAEIVTVKGVVEVTTGENGEVVAAGIRINDDEMTGVVLDEKGKELARSIGRTVKAMGMKADGKLVVRSFEVQAEELAE